MKNPYFTELILKFRGRLLFSVTFVRRDAPRSKEIHGSVGRTKRGLFREPDLFLDPKELGDDFIF